MIKVNGIEAMSNVNQALEWLDICANMAKTPMVDQEYWKDEFHTHLETIRQYIEAQEEKLSDFQTIIEAREKATGGKWCIESYANTKRTPTAICSITENPEPLFEVFGSMQTKNARQVDCDFITTAANITSKYIGGEND